MFPKRPLYGLNLNAPSGGWLRASRGLPGRDTPDTHQGKDSVSKCRVTIRHVPQLILQRRKEFHRTRPLEGEPTDWSHWDSKEISELLIAKFLGEN